MSAENSSPAAADAVATEQAADTRAAGQSELISEAATPPAAAGRTLHQRSSGIRRVPRPRLTGLLDSPIRNLTFGVLYILLVMALATAAYIAVGWSFRDAIW
jgi:hypothetical protein